MTLPKGVCVCARARPARLCVIECMHDPATLSPVVMRLCDACRISFISITPFISRLSQSPQLPHDDTHSRIEHYASRYTLHSRRRRRRLARSMHSKRAQKCGHLQVELNTHENQFCCYSPVCRRKTDLTDTSPTSLQLGFSA